MLKEMLTEEPFMKPVVIPGKNEANRLEYEQVKTIIKNFNFINNG